MIQADLGMLQRTCIGWNKANLILLVLHGILMLEKPFNTMLLKHY